jgi:hypothetical protein
VAPTGGGLTGATGKYTPYPTFYNQSTGVTGTCYYDNPTKTGPILLDLCQIGTMKFCNIRAPFIVTPTGTAPMGVLIPDAHYFPSRQFDWMPATMYNNGRSPILVNASVGGDDPSAGYIQFTVGSLTGPSGAGIGNQPLDNGFAAGQICGFFTDVPLMFF